MSGILVYALHYEGAFNKNSLGAVSEGARLASELGTECDAINEPRYPSLKAIMGAKKKPVDKVTIGDLGIEPDRVGEAGSKARWFNAVDPPAKAGGEIIEDEDTNETVERIVAWLDERKLI